MGTKNKDPIVRRISVDERLSENLIRLEVCELTRFSESGEIADEPEAWMDVAEEGQDTLAGPDESGEKAKGRLYTEVMSIPESLVKQFPWKDLQEGQVFLAGEFRVQVEGSGDEAVNRYFVAPGEKAFERIDDDVKRTTKALYYEVLAKGEKNARSSDRSQ